ncbi:MAG: hypothetical protein GX545_01810 [Fibrobacter sp.]|jgi:hypothetical protein|nr:hypothetical protein [Fibrobacter sp.]
MNKKTLLFLSLSIFSLMACSSSPTAEEKLAENCENGHLDKCLEGSWNLAGLYDRMDLSAAKVTFEPTSSFKFNADKSFEFTLTSATSPSFAAPGCNYDKKNCTPNQLGYWRVEGDTLILTPTGDCLPSKDYPFIVTLDKDNLNLNGRLFHDTEICGIGIHPVLVEKYTRQ